MRSLLPTLMTTKTKIARVAEDAVVVVDDVLPPMWKRKLVNRPATQSLKFLRLSSRPTKARLRPTPIPKKTVIDRNGDAGGGDANAVRRPKKAVRFKQKMSKPRRRRQAQAKRTTKKNARVARDAEDGVHRKTPKNQQTSRRMSLTLKKKETKVALPKTTTTQTTTPDLRRSIARSRRGMKRSK
jgi:hypothetical protein